MNSHMDDEKTNQRINLQTPAKLMRPLTCTFADRICHIWTDRWRQQMSCRARTPMICTFESPRFCFLPRCSLAPQHSESEAYTDWSLPQEPVQVCHTINQAQAWCHVHQDAQDQNHHPNAISGRTAVNSNPLKRLRWCTSLKFRKTWPHMKRQVPNQGSPVVLRKQGVITLATSKTLFIWVADVIRLPSVHFTDLSCLLSQIQVGLWIIAREISTSR